MNISSKRGIAIAGVAALIISGSAAVTNMDAENDSMQLSVSTNLYSTSTPVTTSAAKTEAQQTDIYQQNTTQSGTVRTYTDSTTTKATSRSTTASPVHSSDTPTEQYTDAVIVYVSSTGKYHTREDCSGMKTSTAMDITLAQSAGHAPCSRCCDEITSPEQQPQQAVVQPPISENDIMVYVSATGKYHSRPNCSGMKKYTEMERDEAESAGHVPCQKCW